MSRTVPPAVVSGACAKYVSVEYCPPDTKLNNTLPMASCCEYKLKPKYCWSQCLISLCLTILMLLSPKNAARLIASSDTAAQSANPPPPLVPLPLLVLPMREARARPGPRKKPSSSPRWNKPDRPSTK